jgi:Tol biopolymer transport system component
VVNFIQRLLRILMGRSVAPVPIRVRRFRSTFCVAMLALLTAAMSACWNARDLPPRTNMGGDAITSNRPLPPPEDDTPGRPGDNEPDGGNVNTNDNDSDPGSNDNGTPDNENENDNIAPPPDANENDNENIDTDQIAPRIERILDHFWSIGVPYAGPLPRLLDGTGEITWSISAAPEEMTINRRTGVVAWDDPQRGPWLIEITATGPGGSDTESWTLTVLIPGEEEEEPEDEDGEEGPPPEDIFLASLGDDGSLGDKASEFGTISFDGKRIAFSSQATNLVQGDENGERDAFLRNRALGTTRRISNGLLGHESNGPSRDTAIAGEGRFVAFWSAGANLVIGDTNNRGDIFVYDRQTQVITRESITTGGAEANGTSLNPSISADGRFVAFESLATNLVPGDTNGVMDVFIRDRDLRITVRASVSHLDGEQGNGASIQPSMSTDGRWVAFTSSASNLVALDQNGADDVFIHDRVTDETIRVSVDSGGIEGNGASNEPHIGGDGGQYIVFKTEASNLSNLDDNGEADIYMHDRRARTTILVSIGNDGSIGNSGSNNPVITEDGQYVAFDSRATNLVPNDTNDRPDVFLRDLFENTTRLMSVSKQGVQAEFGSTRPDITAAGEFIVFESKSGGLVPGDINGVTDVFVAPQIPAEEEQGE